MQASTQIPLFEVVDDVVLPDLHAYDSYLIAVSGGKDSIACLLHLLDEGIDRSKIELHHHCVDGFGDDRNPFMDWPVTEDYCVKLAEAFNLPLYFSAKNGGFLKEMLRDNELTSACTFETPEGIKVSGGKGGKPNTRLKFPQKAADLRSRWCSSYLKIDPFSKVITGQTRFCHSKTLVITGERAQESSARSKYKIFEPHRTDARGGRLKRWVDHYRPIHKWDEESVWEIIERYKVNPHPAYKLGWGRLSCMACIFGSPNQWASVRQIAQDRFDQIASLEKQFGLTIDRKYSVEQMADRGIPYSTLSDDLVELAMREKFQESIIVDDWVLPSGAFGESNGSI